jgi:hypothetical protein
VPTVAALLLSLALPPVAAGEERRMGHVFSWGHELNQNELPNWNPARAPVVPPRRWARTIAAVLDRSGRNGLWFSGASALPFRVPLHPKEPKSWRNAANFSARHRQTGLRWDVNLEIWAARVALRRKAVVVDPTAARTAYTRRLSLLDPVYRRTALQEIKRLVPKYRGRPYVHAYSGSDEPIVVLPRGKRALRSAYARRMRREVRREYGWSPPNILAKPTRDVRQQLRWLAYSRWSGDNFFAMKRQQARLIRRLDPGATIVPNDYGFIDGFIPWDYTRLADFADIVEADPYVSFGERQTPGRGRYNPGFGAKLLSDLTGKEVRIIVQAFPHARYTPRPRDLYPWTAQALRAGATHISFFGSDNPRVVAPKRYAAMLDIASRLRGTRLPDKPEDPARLVLYATASEGQGQPWRLGNKRHRTSGDELYTAYALLGELGRGAFSFESDSRLLREPERLAGASAIWLPRAETLDRPVAERLLGWVRAGGTLIVTDPDALTRSPNGRSLADVRAALIGAGLGGRRAGRALLVEEGALAPGVPGDVRELPIYADEARAFSSVPAGARVVARFVDDAPAALLRQVGAGRVLAFSSELMRPEMLDEPLDLVDWTRDLHAWSGGAIDHPAWAYTIPGAPQSARLPWKGAWRPWR